MSPWGKCEKVPPILPLSSFFLLTFSPPLFPHQDIARYSHTQKKGESKKKEETLENGKVKGNINAKRERMKAKKVLE